MHYLGWRGKRNIKRGEQREEEKLGSVLGTNRVRIKKYRETAAAVAGGGSVRFSCTSPRVLSRQWLRRAWMAPPPCPCPPHFQHLLGSLLLLQVPLVLHLKCPWSQNSGHAPTCTDPLDPHAPVSGFWQMPWGSIGRGGRRKRVSTEHLRLRSERSNQSQCGLPPAEDIQVACTMFMSLSRSKQVLTFLPMSLPSCSSTIIFFKSQGEWTMLEKNFINFLFTPSVGFLPGNYRIAYRSILYQEKVD